MTRAVYLAEAASGTVLQVVSTFKNDAFTTASTTFVDIPGMSVTITPKFATSKMLVILNIGGQAQSQTSTNLFNIVRNGTAIAQPAAGTNPASMQCYNGGTACFNAGMNFLDSPATTSALTYKIQGRVDGGTMYFNRHFSSDIYSAVSSITVMEIAA